MWYCSHPQTLLYYHRSPPYLSIFLSWPIPLPPTTNLIYDITNIKAYVLFVLDLNQLNYDACRKLHVPMEIGPYAPTGAYNPHIASWLPYGLSSITVSWKAYIWITRIVVMVFSSLTTGVPQEQWQQPRFYLLTAKYTRHTAPCNLVTPPHTTPTHCNSCYHAFFSPQWE